VKVGITINEVLGSRQQEPPIYRTYKSLDDLPEGSTVKVYAIKEVAIEELVTLSDRARNELRDLQSL